jgi:hypothetical protein
VLPNPGSQYVMEPEQCPFHLLVINPGYARKKSSADEM